MNQTPIILPILIYLISISDNIRTALAFTLTFVAFVLVFATLTSIMLIGLRYEDYTDNKEYVNRIMRPIKKCIMIFIISLFTFLLIPSSETCYKMIAANVITYENVDAGKETVKSAIDYVFEKIDEINGK